MARAFGCCTGGGLLVRHSSCSSSHSCCALRIPTACLRHSALSASRNLARVASKLDVQPAEEVPPAPTAALPGSTTGASSADFKADSASANGDPKAGYAGGNVQQQAPATSGQPLLEAAAVAPAGNGSSSSSNSPSIDSSSSASTISNQSSSTDGYPAWYAAVGLSAVAALICSVDRAAISVAILPMSEQYGWSDTTKGAINSAFYIGYTLTNLVGGYLASSLSAKQVLGWGVVLWSIFTMTTPAAAGSTLPVLLSNRALMGAGEGVTFPCVQNIVKFWCPADVRTRALTLIYSGGQLGTIVALVTAPLIINSFGWPAVFEIYGSLGLLWMFAWVKLVSDAPPLPAAQSKLLQQPAQQQPQQQMQQQSPSAAQEQAVATIQQQQQVHQQAQLLAPKQQQQQQRLTSPSSLPRFSDIPWRSFFTNKAFLAIMMAHSAFGVGHYVCLSWLPTYYNQEFGVDVQQSALLSVLPWFVTVLVSNSSGWIADGLANSGRLSMTRTRKLLQTVGSVGPALCLLYLALAHEDPGQLEMGEAVLCLTATLSIGGFQSAGFASNHQDISSRYAAVLFGITNALSSLMGTFSVYATGLILDATQSWSLVFELVALFYLAGAVAYLALGSAEQQFE